MATYYICFRFWLSFYINSGFPFEKFNLVSDEKIGSSLEDYVKIWLDEHSDKVQRTIEYCRSQFGERSNQIISEQDNHDIKEYLNDLSKEDLKAIITQLGRKTNLRKKEKLIRLAYEDGINCLKTRKFDFSTIFGFYPPRKQGSNIPLIVKYSRIAGWARFPSIIFEKSTASHRRFVCYDDDKDRTDQIAATLQLKYRSDFRCPVFSVIPATDFAPEQRNCIEIEIDDLSKSEPVAEHMRDAQDIVHQVIKISRKIVGSSKHGEIITHSVVIDKVSKTITVNNKTIAFPRATTAWKVFMKLWDNSPGEVDLNLITPRNPYDVIKAVRKMLRKHEETAHLADQIDSSHDGRTYYLENITK